MKNVFYVVGTIAVLFIGWMLYPSLVAMRTAVTPAVAPNGESFPYGVVDDGGTLRVDPNADWQNLATTDAVIARSTAESIPPIQTMVPILQSLPAQTGVSPTPIPIPTIMAIEPPKDWTNEITAVNANMSNAVKLVQACAQAKLEGMAQIPQKAVDCTAVVNNLENAKAIVEDLKAEMSK